MVVHSRLLCSGFSMPSLDVTWLDAVLLLLLLLLVDRELWPGATCNRPRVPFEGCAGMNDVELCRRVLTTSRGQVTMAPTVPAVLEKGVQNKQKQS